MITADSLRSLATAGEHVTAGMDPAQFLESWHEFYMLAGTAAVTLAGLLFVALSFNLDVMIHESKAHILANARSTLFNFAYVLIASLAFLVPVAFAGLAVPIGMIAGGSIGLGVRHVLSTLGPKTSTPSPFERRINRRGRIYTVCYAGALLIAILSFRSHSVAPLSFMCPIVMGLLLNAMLNTWDLLVEVGKLKSKMEL